MILVLAIFTGCKGAGAIFKVAFVAAYVGLRIAAAAAASKHSSSESSSPAPESDCTCAPIKGGQTWCERRENEYQCVLACDTDWVYRGGICVAKEVY